MSKNSERADSEGEGEWERRGTYMAFPAKRLTISAGSGTEGIMVQYTCE